MNRHFGTLSLEIGCRRFNKQFLQKSGIMSGLKKISRGTSLRDLVDSDLWWNGPTWLRKEKADWLRGDVTITQVPEERKLELAFVSTSDDFSILTRFSSWNKLCRVVATCFRFVDNCVRKKGGSTEIIGSLSAVELKKQALLR